MQRFDGLHRQHFERSAKPKGDRDKVRRLLLAFILALRDLPSYGQILLSEGARPSPRLLWLHQHYFPGAFRDIQLEDAKLHALLMKITLVRTAVAGSILYTVVAAPQIALSAEVDGGESPADIYPLSDKLAKRLADMMTSFVFAQLAEVTARK
jgi:hypothetical protein